MKITHKILDTCSNPKGFETAEQLITQLEMTCCHCQFENEIFIAIRTTFNELCTVFGQGYRPESLQYRCLLKRLELLLNALQTAER